MENQTEQPSIADKLEALHAESDALGAKIQALYKASLDAPEDQKVCPDFMARMLAQPDKGMKFPCTVSGIVPRETPVVQAGMRSAGVFVAIRPCDPELAGHTFLGVYLGDIAMSAGVRFNPATGVLEVGHTAHNPAIWIPDLKRIVFGAESWWGPIKKPEDLKQITDADINNVWYVQAMKDVVRPVPLDAPQA